MGILSGANLLEDAPDAPRGYLPDYQAGKQLEILNTERQDQIRRFGQVDQKLEEEIAYVQNPGRRSKPVASFVSGPKPIDSPASAPTSLLGPAIDALDDGGPVKPAKTETRKAEESIPSQVFDAATTPGRVAAEVASNQLTGLGTSIIGGFRGMATLAMGGSLDDAVKAVHGEDAGAVARTTQPVSHGAQAISTAMASPANPMNWAAVASHKAGEVASDVTGSPAVGAGIEAVGNVAPLLLMRGGKPSAVPLRDIGRGSAVEAPKAVTAPTTDYDVPTYLRQREKAPVGPPAAQEVPNHAVAEKGVEPIPAVKFAEAQEAPKGAGALELPQAEQTRRLQVLRDVGVQTPRKSSVTGDPVAGNTDLQIAKVDSDAGNVLKAQLISERKALTSHADKIVQETGGTSGTDTSTLYARGNTILAPLDGLKQWFANQTKTLYDEARAKGQGQGVTLSGLDEQLGKKSNFTGNSDTLHLREGIQDRMTELGMLDKDGKLLPSTVDQVENLRKYINERWTPGSNGVIRSLKNTLDEDVTKAAGTDTFAKARALHQLKAATLDDPKGIANIMDSDGPVNRAVDVEKIPDKITGLGADQLSHIVKTLQTVPAELQPQAQAALAEIKAHFANKLRDVGKSQEGQWNSKGVTTFLKNNSARLPQVFKPEELKNMHNLNEAGQILKIEGGYPGAAAQEHNLVRAGVTAAIRSGAAATGAFLGGPYGAAIGDFVASAATGKLKERAAVNAAKQRMVPLSEVGK